jgi:putative membrane protein
MSSTDSVIALSKYLISLPSTNISLLSMIFLSFLTGSIVSLIEPSTEGSVLYSIFYGGAAGFLIFGITSIMSGGLTQPMINAFKNSRHMKMKQSMFLAFLSMLIVAFFYIIGSLISTFLSYSYTTNALIFGCVLIFAFRMIVIWGTSNINLIKSIFVSSIQPLLILSMVMVIVFLTSITTNIGYFSVFTLSFKSVIASLILVIAIYSFVKVLESPMRKNLGVGALELFSLFLAHYTEGSSALEKLFEDMGEPIETLIGVLSFKNKNGLKAIFLTPCVHPGPVGDIGGGNMPTTLANKFNVFTMVSHGPSTHDFNPVSSKEIDKIEKVVRKALKNMEYSGKVSKFVRAEYKKAKLGAQYFNDNLILLATFSPVGSDDIDFGVGLAIMNEAKYLLRVENVILVDCHNSFSLETGRILAGKKEVFELITALKKLEMPKEVIGLRMGCCGDPMEHMSRLEGIGTSGVKVMIVEVEESELNRQKTAYILLDANNMVEGFREKIIEKVKDLGIDDAEVMTTDTHFINTLSGGHNPVGKEKPDEIIEIIEKCTKNALDDLEDVLVGINVCKIDNLKTLGPMQANELVTTISSIVAVSRVAAPIIFILAILFVFLWIF